MVIRTEPYIPWPKSAAKNLGWQSCTSKNKVTGSIVQEVCYWQNYQVKTNNLQADQWWDTFSSIRCTMYFTRLNVTLLFFFKEVEKMKVNKHLTGWCELNSLCLYCYIFFLTIWRPAPFVLCLITVNKSHFRPQNSNPRPNNTHFLKSVLKAFFTHRRINTVLFKAGLTPVDFIWKNCKVNWAPASRTIVQSYITLVKLYKTTLW